MIAVTRAVMAVLIWSLLLLGVSLGSWRALHRIRRRWVLIVLVAYVWVSWCFGTLSTCQLVDDVVVRGEDVPTAWDYFWQFGLFAAIWPAIPFLLSG